MKKIYKIFRTFLIGAVWTYFFLTVANYIMFSLWNFNFMSARSWQVLNKFFETDWALKTKADYFFLLMLFILPFLWVWGWIKVLKINYLNILLYPINAYNRYIINKYGHDSSRIVLKNIKSSQKIIEQIKTQLESIKPAKTKEVGNIRAEVQKKLEQINQPKH